MPALFLLALALRVAVAFHYGVHQNWPESRTFGDTADYRQIAMWLDTAGRMVLVREDRLIHASRPPLYPLLLAGLRRAFPGSDVNAVLIFQCLMGALTCYLAYRMAKEKFGESAGLIAFFLCAVYPFFIFYAGLFLTETLFVLLYFAVNFLLGKTSERFRAGWAALAGAALGLGALTRGEMLAFPFIALPAWALAGEKRLPRIYGALLAAAVAAVVVAPWALRNAAVFDGAFVPGTTRLGHDLYEANNPAATGGVMSDEIDWDTVTGLGGEGIPDRECEIKSDRILREKALEWIAANPGRFLALVPEKQWRTWRPAPGYHEFRKWHFILLSAVSYAPIMMLALCGAWLLRKQARSALLPLLIPVAFVALVHCVFLGSMRYNLPAMPFLIILAAVALDRAASAVIARRREARSRAAGD